jgi:phasin family protein
MAIKNANKNANAATEVNPFGDLTKMLEQFKVPGVDMSSLVDARRKDIEALVEANKAVYEGMQALALRQADMLKQAVQGIQDAAKSATSAVGDPVKQAELARNAMLKALSDTKDLAEIVRSSQADAMARITERSTQNMQDMKKMMQPR